MNPHLNIETMRCTRRRGRDQFGNTVLHQMLLQNREISAIKRLLKIKTFDVNASGFFDYSPLQLAVLGDHPLEVITTLINHGADLNHQDLSGKTVLHLLVGKGTETRVIPLLKLLLQHGANIHARDVRGQTPLHHTSRHSNFLYIQTLVENGASVMDQDEHGRTPLHLALISMKQSLNISSLLRLVGDSVVDLQDSFGKTPLHLATALRPDYLAVIIVEKMLETHHASMHILDNNSESPLDLAIADDRVMEMFTRYALKLKCLNISFPNSNQFDFLPFQALLEKCLKEVQTMKLCKFGKYSMYDIFSKKRDPIYLNNQEAAQGIQAAIESPDLKKEFSMYSSLLEKTYMRNKQRLLLLNESVEVFDVRLPVEIRRMVLCHLENQDLLNILKLKKGKFRRLLKLNISDQCECEYP